MIPVSYKGETYSLTVERHERGYFGYFPALPGCHGWGATYDGAVKAARESLILSADAASARRSYS